MLERLPSSGPSRRAGKVDDARISRGWYRGRSPAEIVTLRSQMKKPKGAGPGPGSRPLPSHPKPHSKNGEDDKPHSKKLDPK